MGGLPAKDVVQSMVNAYFVSESWSLPVLEENHFRSALHRFYEQLSSKNTGSLSTQANTFPAVLFALLAVELQSTELNSLVSEQLDTETLSAYRGRNSQWYLEIGQGIIDLVPFQKPTTASIEYYLLKMAWLKNVGRGDASWQCLGIALRQAQQLNLHQMSASLSHELHDDVSPPLEQFWQMEYRTRLWAKIFIFDCHMAVALGRPRGIHLEDCTMETPLDCGFPANPSIAIPTPTRHGFEPPNSFSSVLFSIALSYKYHEMMSMRNMKLDLKDENRIQKLHDDVDLLLNTLPPALRPSYPDTTWDGQKPELPALRLRLLTTASIFLLALHRPYVATHVTSRVAAMKAALTSLQAQQDLFGCVSQAQQRLYSYTFYTVDAGIFLAATELKYPHSATDMASKVLAALEQAVARLLLVKDHAPTAKLGCAVLERCYALVKQHNPDSGDAWFGVIEDIPNLDEETMNYLRGLGSQVIDPATQHFLSVLAEYTESTFSHIGIGSTLSTSGDE